MWWSLTKSERITSRDEDVRDGLVDHPDDDYGDTNNNDDATDTDIDTPMNALLPLTPTTATTTTTTTTKSSSQRDGNDGALTDDEHNNNCNIHKNLSKIPPLFREKEDHHQQHQLPSVVVIVVIVNPECTIPNYDIVRVPIIVSENEAEKVEDMDDDDETKMTKKKITTFTSTIPVSQMIESACIKVNTMILKEEHQSRNNYQAIGCYKEYKKEKKNDRADCRCDVGGGDDGHYDDEKDVVVVRHTTANGTTAGTLTKDHPPKEESSPKAMHSNCQTILAISIPPSGVSLIDCTKHVQSIVNDDPTLIEKIEQYGIQRTTDDGDPPTTSFTHLYSGSADVVHLLQDGWGTEDETYGQRRPSSQISTKDTKAQVRHDNHHQRYVSSSSSPNVVPIPSHNQRPVVRGEILVNVLVLLMCSKSFELVHTQIHVEETSCLKQFLAMVPNLSQQPSIQQEPYVGLYNYSNHVTLFDMSSFVQDIFRNETLKKSKAKDESQWHGGGSVIRNEILVVLPQSLSTKECIHRANRLLGKVISKLHSMEDRQ